MFKSGFEVGSLVVVVMVKEACSSCSHHRLQMFGLTRLTARIRLMADQMHNLTPCDSFQMQMC